MKDIEARLQSTVPFHEMDSSAISELAERAQPRRFDDGTFLVHEGQCWPALFLIERGEIEAIKVSREGRSLVAVTFSPGEIFWGLAFFDDQMPMPVSLRAKGESSILLWTKEQLLPLLLEHSRSLWALNTLVVQRMLRASTIVEDLAFQPVAGRIAKLLLTQHSKAGSDRIERDLTLDEMAARVGTTREMVCRVLYKLADQEIISITRTEFSVEHRDKLAHMAGELGNEPIPEQQSI